MNSKNHLFLPVGFHWSKIIAEEQPGDLSVYSCSKIQSIEHTLKTLIQFLTFQQEYNATF